ncbi:MAG: hypothetical protein HRU17_16835 [Polyangiaceae bacterium]|nr:hypothetical protein [Polyangiaceae bacterium]
MHHSALRTGNQRHCDVTELRTAQLYMNLLTERGIKVTLFASGRCFTEEWRELRPIANHPLVELGGHNFSCLTPAIVHRISGALVGSYNGPAWLQRVDVELTKAAYRWRMGQEMRLWRNHMYKHGPYTDRVLSDAGVHLCSDGVKRSCVGPTLAPGGLLNWPLNIIPDHEHIYHAERTPEWVENWQRRYHWCDDFGAQSYPIADWTDLVLSQLRANEARGVVSNMIIHPITMYLSDRFASFGRIADYLATRHTEHLGAAARSATVVPKVSPTVKASA